MSEEKWYSWVDANPTETASKFSGRRTMKLLLVVIGLGLLGGIPSLLWKLFTVSATEAEKERIRQEKLEHEWRDGERAAHEGRTGEAAKRLFGVE